MFQATILAKSHGQNQLINPLHKKKKNDVEEKYYKQTVLEVNKVLVFRGWLS